MKYCNKCKVNVAGNRLKCPLCQNELEILNNEGNIEKFPEIKKKKTGFAWKFFIFLSIVAMIICVMINYEFPQGGMWSKFVILAFITLGINLFIVVKKHKNVLKCLFFETIIISGFVAFWDYYTGMQGWSINWVLPILFIIILATMGILSKCLKISSEEHIVYLLSTAVLGMIPIIFLIKNMLYIKLPSVICAGVSGIFFFAIIVFEGKKMLEEFKRRFHV